MHLKDAEPPNVHTYTPCTLPPLSSHDKNRTWGTKQICSYYLYRAEHTSVKTRNNWEAHVHQVCSKYCFFHHMASRTTNISNAAIHVAQKASHCLKQAIFSYNHTVSALSIGQWHIQIFIWREMEFGKKTRQTWEDAEEQRRHLALASMTHSHQLALHSHASVLN